MGNNSNKKTIDFTFVKQFTISQNAFPCIICSVLTKTNKQRRYYLHLHEKRESPGIEIVAERNPRMHILNF